MGRGGKGVQLGGERDLRRGGGSAGDTSLTLIDGTKYIVRESMTEVIARVNEHRAHLLARAQEIQATPHPAVELVRETDTGTRPADTDDDGPLAETVPLRPRSR